MEKWTPLPLDKGIFRNVDDAAVIGFNTAIENGYLNDLGGHSRFPGLVEFAELQDNGRVVLSDLNGDLIAATSKGQVYRIDKAGNVLNVTGVPLSGGKRAIFAKTDRGEMHIAAGGSIVRLRTDKTELLSEDAPQSTHVGFIDGFSLATEINSNRFYHTPAGRPDVWNPLDTFAADGSSDNINSMIITPFREIMIGGAESIEQFESTRAGDTPFFRRWSTGEGVAVPYAMIFADNALWTLNKLFEFVRVSGQVSIASSAEIGAFIEAIDDWRDGWIGGYPASPLHIEGQKFIILQAPYATNPYGTKGVTLLFDYRNKRWSELYGFDVDAGTPTRWPGWSHWPLWGKIFVGGEGRIYEMKSGAHTNAGQLQRWLVRTANVSEGRDITIERFRLRLKRGIGSSSAAPEIAVRCSRDGRPFGPWIRRSLGRSGDTRRVIEFGGFGTADTFQWEISSNDDSELELMRAEVIARPVGH